MAISYFPEEPCKAPQTPNNAILTTTNLSPQLSSSQNFPSTAVSTSTINYDDQTTIDFVLKLDTAFAYPVVVTIKHILKITYPTLENVPEVCYELENSYIVNPPPPSYSTNRNTPVQNTYTCKFALPPGCIPPTNSQININIIPN